METKVHINKGVNSNQYAYFNNELDVWRFYTKGKGWFSVNKKDAKDAILGWAMCKTRTVVYVNNFKEKENEYCCL